MQWVKVFMTLYILSTFSSTVAAAEEFQVCNYEKVDELISVVQDDFYKIRMPRWEKDSEVLGTQKPDLIFDKNNITGSDVILLPFIAGGIQHKKEYFALYKCRDGNIEYSSGNFAPLK
ncbi:YebF family protein [Serratia sp. L9]|uniref:YebF family protein n=1 Tax=Serratia sp. L9 TaxID=3423946 RepID=UPI003D67D471